MAAWLRCRMANDSAGWTGFKLGTGMKWTLATVLSLITLSSADVRIAMAADIDSIGTELDMRNSLVHCIEPTDCSAVMPVDAEADRTAGARALAQGIAALGAGSSSFDITRDGIVALVGDIVGTGMVPSQSVMVANAAGDVGTAHRGELRCSTGQQSDAVTLSVTVAPAVAGFTVEKSGGAPNGVAPVSNIRCGGAIAVRSVSVGRSGHDVGFVHTTNSTVPISDFPIAGGKPVYLAIDAVTGTRPYPFRSGGIRP